jgi:hypothetical protein
MSKQANDSRTTAWLTALAIDAVQASKENAAVTAMECGWSDYADTHPEYVGWLLVGIEDHVYNGEGRAPEYLRKRTHRIALACVGHHPVQVARRKSALTAQGKPSRRDAIGGGK